MLDAHRAARLLATAVRNVRALGDMPGHEFHGNQWTAGLASLADELKSSVNHYQGVFYSNRETMTGVLAKAREHHPHATMEKVKRGFYVKIGDKAFGPSGLKALESHSETPLHRLADSFVPQLSVALRHAFAMGRKALGKPPSADAAVDALKFTLRKTLGATLAKIAAEGANVALGSLKTAELRTLKRGDKPPKIKLHFDASDSDAVDWADRHAAELIDGISEATREAINNAIADALERGSIDDAYDEILAAVGDTDRAELIARNETMRAASEGQRLGWERAVEDGFLTGDEKRTWITVGDGKVCPICDELDGATADLDGEYPGEGGDGPPAHVSCRCTEGLI